MSCSRTLKKADAFKVYGTFIIPKESSKSDSSLYSTAFGSIPGTIFTFIAAFIAAIYLIP